MNIKTKIRTFNAFAASVFLYNSELWTTTSTTANEIDSFHCRMLRKAININWPKKISNADLYRMTKMEPWSKTIKRRRLNWLGHLMRMPANTPARISLHEAFRPVKKKVGKTPTWLKVIEKDLSNTVHIDIYNETPDQTVAKLKHATRDRKVWKNTIKNIMESNL